MNTNIYYPNLIRNDQNKYRLNLVIYDLLNEVLQKWIVYIGSS